jgi:hypothetical protein
MFFDSMIASMIIDFSRFKVAIKVIRSAFTDKEVKQFNEVSSLIRCGRLDPVEKDRPRIRNFFGKQGFGLH